MSEGLVNKAQYHFERLNDIINHGKTPVPLSIELQITNTCHQACYYCNSEIFRKHNPDKATTEDWINFIDNLPDGINDVTFSGGGEPLDHLDADKIINHVLRKGYKVGLITNGARFRHLNFTEEYKPSWVGIDVDTADSKKYFQIRRGNLEKVKKSISEKMNQFQGYGTFFTYKVLINDYNKEISDLKANVDLAVEMGFDEYFQRIVYFSDRTATMERAGKRTLEPPDGYTWEEVEIEVRNYCEEKGISYKGTFGKQRHSELINQSDSNIENYSWSDIDWTHHVKQCFAPLFYVVVNSNGNVLWCCEHLGNQDYVIDDWIENGLNFLQRDDLLDKMKNFLSWKKCSSQCRYYDYNKYAARISDGYYKYSENELKTGHEKGFF